MGEVKCVRAAVRGGGLRTAAISGRLRGGEEVCDHRFSTLESSPVASLQLRIVFVTMCGCGCSEAQLGHGYASDEHGR